MTFAAPLFLIAVLAGAIPVVLHMMNRQKAKDTNCGRRQARVRPNQPFSRHLKNLQNGVKKTLLHSPLIKQQKNNG